MARAPFDAIVVGSGISGGWAAKELSEKGLNVLILEAGRSIDPARDFLMNAPAFEFDYRYLGDIRKLTARQSVQRKCYACDEGATQFFVDDVDNPYTTADGKPFDWIRGRQMGGKSIMWGRQCYRWSDLDFGANAKDGHGTDWPVRYKELAPWYDYVEGYAGISGEKLGLPQLPDGPFLPPMEMSCAEQWVRDGIKTKYSGNRVLTIGRTANLSVAHNGRAACHYCDACHRGCTTAAYFNSVQTTLKDAFATGRCTIRPYSVVHSLIWNEEQGKVTGVRVVDGQTMETLDFNSKIIFLNCSALESTRILLNSKSRSHPQGLGGNRGVLGRYVMDHTMQAGAGGNVPGFLDKTTYGSRPNGVYLPRFRNVTDQHPDFLRGYAYQGGGGRSVSGWGRGTSMPGFGTDFKNALKQPEYGGWRMSLGGFGECLPNVDNQVSLHPDKVDRWGVPVLHIDVQWRENELKMQQDAMTQAAEMLEAAGVTNVTTYNSHTAPGLTIHEMGGARMGKDPKTSVLNKWNQHWDSKNLFVTDGAAMASSACQNPSITYMAFTARAADYAVRALNRKEL
ncbi:MAG: GMC family oxidoreductase [Gemmatimonadales bacterium]